MSECWDFKEFRFSFNKGKKILSAINIKFAESKQKSYLDIQDILSRNFQISVYPEFDISWNLVPGDLTLKFFKML